MPDQIQLRGGSEAENDAFTGAQREVTVDTTNKTLRIHDGTTAGGSKLPAYDEWGRLQVADPVNDSDVANKGYVDTLNPFRIKDTQYNSGDDKLVVTVSPGRVDWGSGNITEFSSDTTVEETPISTSTTYYVFINDDDSLSISTTNPTASQVRLGSVATGASKDDLTTTDLRGILPVTPPLGGTATLAYPHAAANDPTQQTPVLVGASTTYTVPAGKVLYITFMHGSTATSINGENAWTGMDGSEDAPANPFIVAAGMDVLVGSSSAFVGFLVDEVATITPIATKSLDGAVYTVPAGKVFVLLNAFRSVKLEANAGSGYVDLGSGYGSSPSSGSSPFLPGPAVFAAGTAVNFDTTTGDGSIFGYEVTL